ncbi:transcriptional regulator [Pontibacillus halophilus JSM 076056 = DSM 19796]|uniref:Transcriptional regulator n=1 Tax=Pontibacillus halophilus JSM 076056 = DSM 19796 TaxID=1385510 RepID=A0A0A5I9A3_9BACI|nr:transcriptional regulator [Pontibacillus halophilus JSM 076056 = DSM 19796]
MHLISDEMLPFQQFVRLSEQLLPYMDTFHVREKGSSDEIINEKVKQLLQVIPSHQTILHSFAHVAERNRLRGVQIPSKEADLLEGIKEQYPSLQRYRSVHSLEEAKRAEADGATCLVYGHVFMTRSKQGQQGRGLQSLSELVETVSIPVVAIGGITPERVKEVASFGASGIAVMSGILRATDPVETAKQYREEWEKCKSL